MGDFNYDEIQASLNPTLKHGDAEGDPLFDMDDSDRDVEQGPRLGDDEDMIPELDNDEEADEKPTAKKEQPPSKKGKVEDEDEDDEAAKVREAVLKVVGSDAVLTIKGVDRKVADLTPLEIKNYLQKSIRADQIFNETSAMKKQLEAERQKLEADRALVEKAAATVHGYLTKLDGKGTAKEPNVEALLKVSEDDPEETVALKTLLGNTLERLNRIEGTAVQSERETQIRSLVSEVEGFRKDYPMASADEVLAIRAVRPDIDTETLMKASHEYYSGDKHIQEALQANPEFMRRYNESVIKAYLSQKAKTNTVTGIKSGASSIEKVSTKPKTVSRDFRSADANARAFLKELAGRD